MKLVNLTTHEIVIFPARGTTALTIPPSGIVARLSTRREQVNSITADGGFLIPINRTVFGDISGLPESEEGTLYIASALLAQAVLTRGRKDVVMVDDTIRNDAGQIVGCRALAIP